jgi:hypothetical protein
MVKTGDGAWRGRLGGVEDLEKFAQSQLLPLPQYVELSHHCHNIIVSLARLEYPSSTHLEYL